MSEVMQLAHNATPCACGNCEWKGPARELAMISDFEERVSAGEIVPAGQCPQCGCLAHMVEPPVPPAPARIVVIVYGGVVQNVENVPHGVTVEVRDYDVNDTPDEEGAAPYPLDADGEPYLAAIYEATP